MFWVRLYRPSKMAKEIWSSERERQIEFISRLSDDWAIEKSIDDNREIALLAWED